MAHLWTTRPPLFGKKYTKRWPVSSPVSACTSGRRTGWSNDLLLKIGDTMKHIATLALLLHLGAAAIYAKDQPVKMTFSGTGAPSAANLLQPNTSNEEDNLAGKGTLGSFTFRQIRAISNSAGGSPPSSCSGANLLFFPDLAG